MVAWESDRLDTLNSLHGNLWGIMVSSWLFMYGGLATILGSFYSMRRMCVSNFKKLPTLSSLVYDFDQKFPKGSPLRYCQPSVDKAWTIDGGYRIRWLSRWCRTSYKHLSNQLLYQPEDSDSRWGGGMLSRANQLPHENTLSNGRQSKR